MTDVKRLREAAVEHRDRLGMRTEDLIRWRQEAHPEKVLDLIAAAERLFSSLDEALGLADMPEHCQDEEWQTRRKELGRICDEYVNFDLKPNTPPVSWKTAYYDLENERNRREHDLRARIAALEVALSEACDLADAHIFVPTSNAAVAAAVAPANFATAQPFNGPSGNPQPSSFNVELNNAYAMAACAPAPQFSGQIFTIDTGKPYRDKARIDELRRVGGGK